MSLVSSRMPPEQWLRQFAKASIDYRWADTLCVSQEEKEAARDRYFDLLGVLDEDPRLSRFIVRSALARDAVP